MVNAATQKRVQHVVESKKEIIKEQDKNRKFSGVDVAAMMMPNI